MATAIHDQNRIKVKLGVLFSDGVTLVPISIDSVTGAFKMNMTDSVSAGILNSFVAGAPIPRDANHQPAWCGVSNIDPSVVLPIFVDANGSVLVNNS